MVPFAVLMERLFLGGYTAQYAAALAILTAAVLLLFNASGIAPVQQIMQRFSSAIITTGPADRHDCGDHPVCLDHCRGVWGRPDWV
jgi:hypothetical protein